MIHICDMNQKQIMKLFFKFDCVKSCPLNFKAVLILSFSNLEECSPLIQLIPSQVHVNKL